MSSHWAVLTAPRPLLSVQETLHVFPKMTADPLDSGSIKVHLGGEGYNRKTLNRVKRSAPKPQVRPPAQSDSLSLNGRQRSLFYLYCWI